LSIFQILYFGGLVLNEAVNWVLKHTIRERRPSRGKRTTIFEFQSNINVR